MATSRHRRWLRYSSSAVVVLVSVLSLWVAIRTERANRDIALGRGNWTFLGSDKGGRTAAVLQSFVASCKRAKVEPFAWFSDVLGRIADYPVNRLEDLLPHNWKTLHAAPAR